MNRWGCFTKMTCRHVEGEWELEDGSMYLFSISRRYGEWFIGTYNKATDDFAITSWLEPSDRTDYANMDACFELVMEEVE